MQGEVDGTNETDTTSRCQCTRCGTFPNGTRGPHDARANTLCIGGPGRWPERTCDGLPSPVRPLTRRAGRPRLMCRSALSPWQHYSYFRKPFLHRHARGSEPRRKLGKILDRVQGFEVERPKPRTPRHRVPEQRVPTSRRASLSIRPHVEHIAPADRSERNSPPRADSSDRKRRIPPRKLTLPARPGCWPAH